MVCLHIHPRGGDTMNENSSLRSRRSCEKEKTGERLEKTACTKTKLFRFLRPPVDGKNRLALCICLVDQNRVNMQVVWCSKL